MPINNPTDIITAALATIKERAGKATPNEYTANSHTCAELVREGIPKLVEALEVATEELDAIAIAFASIGYLENERLVREAITQISTILQKP